SRTIRFCKVRRPTVNALPGYGVLLERSGGRCSSGYRQRIDCVAAVGVTGSTSAQFGDATGREISSRISEIEIESVLGSSQESILDALDDELQTSLSSPTGTSTKLPELISVHVSPMRTHAVPSSM